MIKKGELDYSEVEFYFKDVDETHLSDVDGRLKVFPEVYGMDLYMMYLDILIGLR